MAARPARWLVFPCAREVPTSFFTERRIHSGVCNSRVVPMDTCSTTDGDEEGRIDIDEEGRIASHLFCTEEAPRAELSAAPPARIFSQPRAHTKYDVGFVCY